MAGVKMIRIEDVKKGQLYRARNAVEVIVLNIHQETGGVKFLIDNHNGLLPLWAFVLLLNDMECKLESGG